MEIRGRVVLITGASSGIGAACADAFRARGAWLSLVSRSLSPSTPGDLVISADITQEAHQRRAIEQTVQHFGTVDILVNNAGCGLYGPSWAAAPAQYRELFEVNLFAAMALTQQVVPLMQQQESGMIVNISSIAALVPLPWLTLYSASKAALTAFTDGLRMELKDSGIHAMAVHPGYVQTDFHAHTLGGVPPPAIQRRRLSALTPAQCAHDIMRGVERNARTVMTPRSGWLYVTLERLAPTLVERQLARMNRPEAT